jgi:hypothetical protein
MQHLQSFSLFEARASILTIFRKAFLYRYTRGTWSVNRQTGLVDVEGTFDCSGKGLKSLSGISFGHVIGNFYCYNNQLTSLSGAPQTVDGHFYCGGNQLTTLVGAPQTVDGDFSCSRNHLTTLAGSPQTVDGDFYCSSNQLTTLVGAPQTVDGDFYCGGNQLTSLAGAPQTVSGGFDCDSFTLQKGEWNPQGWLAILATGDSKARSLIVTLPLFDAGFWLQKLKGDLKKDGQVLLQLASLWDEPGWEEQRQEIEQRLSPEQLRVIKALKTKLVYVDPWKDGIV